MFVIFKLILVKIYVKILIINDSNSMGKIFKIV